MSERRGGGGWLLLTWAAVIIAACLGPGASADKGKPLISNDSSHILASVIMYSGQVPGHVSRRGEGYGTRLVVTVHDESRLH